MRHGTFEIKLMVLVETQRSVEMTTDVVRAERGSAFCIRVLSWFTSNGSTSAKSFSWSWLRGLAMFCMQYSLILYQTVMKQAVLLYPLTKDFILFAWWSSVLSPWIPDNGGASTDLHCDDQAVLLQVAFVSISVPLRCLLAHSALKIIVGFVLVWSQGSVMVSSTSDPIPLLLV